MSLRRVLHPWFDTPEVHALRASCISQEADYISHERGETRAWNSVRLELHPGQQLPWITGPSIRRTDPDLTRQNDSMMQDLLDAKGIEEGFLRGVDHFCLTIGRDSLCISYHVGRDRFRVSSETRDPKADPVSWLTGGGIHLEAVPRITATEEAEIGGRRAHLLEQFETRAIRRTLLSYDLDEERDLTTAMDGLDFTHFQFNMEHTR
ncbi:hypothetical protein [uncultured Salinicola sp.]|uniref:hypothetical protein n=1 Tax=uncultured Salinicola sp. TaxID=1193542 RepID=UPI00260A5DB0|nr:hypothetical protein [uncultured Salinicola sp.]